MGVRPSRPQTISATTVQPRRSQSISCFRPLLLSTYSAKSKESSRSAELQVGVSDSISWSCGRLAEMVCGRVGCNPSHAPCVSTVTADSCMYKLTGRAVSVKSLNDLHLFDVWTRRHLPSREWMARSSSNAGCYCYKRSVAFKTFPHLHAVSVGLHCTDRVLKKEISQNGDRPPTPNPGPTISAYGDQWPTDRPTLVSCKNPNNNSALLYLRGTVLHSNCLPTPQPLVHVAS